MSPESQHAFNEISGLPVPQGSSGPPGTAPASRKQEYLKLKGLTAEERVAAVGIKNPYAPFL